MYHAAGRLPHLLKPEAYFDPAFAEREREAFRGAWHLVGALDDLPRPGDFRTIRVLGHELIVRNLRGEVRTFANVCAHRHCLLKREAQGAALELICPYHGWRYDDAGRAQTVRGVEYFKSGDAGRPALRRYRTVLCGRLIFVQLDETGPSLKAFLGDLYDICGERFGDDYRPTIRLDLDYRANWKVPIENSLETYHAPNVHPTTFGGDPGEARSEHRLEPRRTDFRTVFVFGPRHPVGRFYQRLQHWTLRRLGETPTDHYRHVHVFPNLTFAFADGLSLVQAMEPAGPTTSRGVVRQFGLRRRAWRWRTPLALLWGWVLARIIRLIMSEDIALYGQVQKGLESSPHAGMLGRCEERIHAFQHWLLARMEEPPAP